jgi:Domain of unknown function (DUF5979)
MTTESRKFSDAPARCRRRSRSRTLTTFLAILALFTLPSITVFASPASADGTLNSGFEIDGFVPDVPPPAPGPSFFADPNGSVQELDVVNQSTAKLGNIQSDVAPTLDYNDENPGNDLSGVWMQTNVVNGKVWLYFAYSRDAASTGQVVFEFNKLAAPAACNYTNAILTNPPGADAATQTFINTCNPWANRQVGDFSFAFDAQGQNLFIQKRTFNGTGWIDNGALPATAAAAASGPNDLTGEGVVNLTDTVFPQNPTQCLTTANILPYTITGNSDSADMKDVVLADFTDSVSVSSCGTVQVKKVTVPAGQTGTFPYTLARADNSALKFSGATTVAGTLTSDGDTDTVNELLTGTNYTLTEGSLTKPWEEQTIACTINGTTSSVYPDGQNFSVQPSTITKCTITNNLKTGSLKLSKQLTGGPNTYNGPFTIAYDCGTGFSGTKSVTPGSFQTVPDIPWGRSCTVSETVPTAPTGYSFGTPTFSPSATVEIGNGTTVEVTTNNTLTPNFPDGGSLTLAKSLTGGPSGYSGPFTIAYACTPGTISGSVSVAAGASSNPIPIPLYDSNGTAQSVTCTVSETVPSAPTGYSFGTPTFSPSNVVTIDADGSTPAGPTATVTTQNTLTRDLGSLVLAKSLTGGPSGYSGPFTIGYDCGTGLTGSVSVSAGGSATVSNIPTGTSCTVSETVPSAPTGYSFGTPTFSPSATATIPAGNGSTITVTTNNTLTRDKGSLKITKTVSGATFSGTFTVKVTCTGDGGTYNSVSVVYPTPGFVTISNIPTGNDCTVTEPTFPTAPAGYAWAAPVITGSPATISKGTTVEVTVANTLQTGHVQVVKTVGGQPVSTTNNCTDPSGVRVGCTFQLRKDATTIANGTTLETQSTLNGTTPQGTLTFTTKLVPGQTYQICEVVLAGWLSSLGTFVPGSFNPPDGTVANPNVDNSTLCGNFVAQPDTTTSVGNVFTIDNTPPPGGRALTIGFWKNWSSCNASKGGQKPILDEALALAEPNGVVLSAGSGTYPVFGPTLYLVVHGSTTNVQKAPDCAKAVNLLNKSTIDGKTKMASDPAFNLAAQLTAAELNYVAGAGKKPTVTTAIQQAVLLLGKYQFNGLTHTTISAADAATMNSLATLLDNYNNNRP